TLIPLIVGFVLLLGLISAVAFVSVRLMDDVGLQARDVGVQRTGRLNLLWDIRLNATRVDNEARVRAMTESGSPNLTPPFSFRLKTSRDELINVARKLDSPPVVNEPSWQELRKDLQSYIEVTQDPKTYSLKGFEAFREVDSDLNELFTQAQSRNEDVIRGVIALQLN